MNSVDSWCELIYSRQRDFMNPDAESGARYLREARETGRAWGAYPGLPSDLYHSALAIQALHASGDPMAVGITADAALHFQRKYNEQIDRLSLEDATYLLQICHYEPGSQQVLTERLWELVEQKYREISTDSSVLSLRTAALLAIVCRQSGREKSGLHADLVLYLLDSQRSEDGSWPSITGEPGSIVPTVFAVRALRDIENDSANDATQRGIGYVTTYLEEKRWEGIGYGGDTFTQAHLLTLIAGLKAPRYELIQSGIDALIHKHNADGGWGAGRGEPSGVEPTSLVLIALSASGESKFVPVRLASAALEHVRIVIEEVSNERDELRHNFEKQVQITCGKVTEERNKLVKRVRRLEGELQRKHDIVDEAVLPLRLRRRLDPALGPAALFQLRLRLSVFMLLVLIGFSVMAYRARLSGAITLTVLILFTIITWFYHLWLIPPAMRKANRNFSELPSVFTTDVDEVRTARTPRISVLRREFAALSEDWNPMTREEFVYRLFSELVHMPHDVAMRYIEDLVPRLGLKGSDRIGVERWVFIATQLEPDERRILFEQVRRMVLK